MKKMLLFVSVLAFSIEFLFCAKQQQQQQSPQQKSEKTKSTTQFEGVSEIDYTSWEVGKPGGTLIRAQFGGDPKSFNPIIMAEATTIDVLNLVFNISALVRRNQLTMAWEPHLAEKWVISDDKKTITYTLRKDLKWSDGHELTADDFTYTVNELILNKKVQTNQRDGQFIGGKAAVWEALDKHTIKITLPEVYAGIFELSSINVVPKHLFKPLVDSQGIEAVNSFWGVSTDIKQIVGCGPFVITEYLPSQKIVFKPNPYYYEKDEKGQKLPYLDQVVFLFVEDQDTELNKFVAGEINMYRIRGEDYAVLINKKKDLNFELYNVGPGNASVYLGFNMNYYDDDKKGLPSPKADWVNKKKFRQALAHVLDRKTIINNIVYGFGYPQYSIIPASSPFYWKGQEQESADFNPEKAKQLLDELGYTDKNGDGVREDDKGNKISLLLNTNTGNRIREAIGENITQEAKKIGIELVFKPVDFNSLVGKLNTTYDWEMIILGFISGPDPVTMANIIPSTGYLHLNEPRQATPKREWEKTLDNYWREANQTVDDAARIAGFEKIQRLWIDEHPWIYTFNPAVIYAVNAKLGNIKPKPFSIYEWQPIMHRIFIKN
ncbi:MAG: ABC transporter substrate-binding protein [Chitinivibrionales bacterium]|nr:ABC transporter substrate-binding protein [Chitinivibrionales bacterium]